MTKVKFIKEGADVLAIFPRIIEKRDGSLLCYAHIGQHSTCHPSYLAGKKLAKYNQYYDLLRELVQSANYKDLHVINYETEFKDCWRNPTPYELVRGYGAIHYRTFKLSEIGHNAKGKLKKWFVSPDDGLRYYSY